MTATMVAARVEAMNYAMDSRNCGPDRQPVLYTIDAEGCEVEIPLPTTWVVCDVCRGEGRHVSPSIDSAGLSAEDFEEDPDFAEDYRSGVYDQTCNRCEGRTTVRMVDITRLTPTQKTAYNRQLKEQASHRAEILAEIRMGA